MIHILIIAGNTYKEIIRDKILYSLVLFAILLFSLSLALGQLSFSEQARITSNFGLTAIHLSSVILAIFLGSTLVSKEIEKKTVMTLLTRPIARWQFIVGKAVGLVGVILFVIFGLSLILTLLVWALHLEFGWNLLTSVYGIFLESLILLCFALFFSSFTRPFLVVSFSLSIYFIGHWLDSLLFFATNSNSDFFKAVSFVITHGLPNLERLNWRSLIIYQKNLPGIEIIEATLYSGFWVVLLIILTVLVLRKKDFG